MISTSTFHRMTPTQRPYALAVAITALALVVAMLLPPPAARATEKASLTVTLNDIQGKPVYFQILFVRLPGSDKVLTGDRTSEDGTIKLTDLPVGDIDVHVGSFEDRDRNPKYRTTLKPGNNELTINLADDHGELTGTVTGMTASSYLHFVCAESDVDTRCIRTEGMGGTSKTFSFASGEALPAATYQLKGYFTTDGYVPDEAGFFDLGTQVVAAGKSHTTTADVSATKDATLSGHITGMRNNSFAYAKGKLVTAYGEFPFTADRFGRFTVTGKFRGLARVRFEDGKLMPLEQGLWVDHGSKKHHDLSLADLPRSVRFGRITNAENNRGIRGARVKMCPRYVSDVAATEDTVAAQTSNYHVVGDRDCFTANTRRGGWYRLDMPAFAYDMTIEKRGYGTITDDWRLDPGATAWNFELTPVS